MVLSSCVVRLGGRGGISPVQETWEEELPAWEAAQLCSERRLDSRLSLMHRVIFGNMPHLTSRLFLMCEIWMIAPTVQGIGYR